jgi:mannosyltransferase OCH1-like enzyme
MEDKYIANYLSFKNNKPKRIPKILHMVWVGDKEIPEYCLHNFTAWQILMPNWHFVLWNNNYLTSSFFDQSYLNLINSSTNNAQKADMVRYYVVKKFGGFYVDADIIPNRSLNDLLIDEPEFIMCHDMVITWPYIINSFFASVPNHPVLKNICEEIYNADLLSADIHMETGPRLFGHCLLSYQPLSRYTVLHPNSFYRNRVGDLKLRDIDLEFIDKCSDTYANGMCSRLDRLYERCLSGDKTEPLDKDIEWRFGSHSYEATWR